MLYTLAEFWTESLTWFHILRDGRLNIGGALGSAPSTCVGVTGVPDLH